MKYMKQSFKAQSTTSKPVVEQAPEEDEVEGEDAFEESQENDAPTTTTETAKKLRSGGVRPFRYPLDEIPHGFHIEYRYRIDQHARVIWFQIERGSSGCLEEEKSPDWTR